MGGQSKCSQYCQRGTRIGCESVLAGPSGYPGLGSSCSSGIPACDEAVESCVKHVDQSTWPDAGGEPPQLMALGYTPPPTPEIGQAAQVLLGTTMPRKPPAEKVHGVPPRVPGSSSRYSTSRYPTCARPGEPVNQVFVQFSNDLEGFLPYTLVISEEHGLEFTSLSQSPDFRLNPLHIMKVHLVSYETLMQ